MQLDFLWRRLTVLLGAMSAVLAAYYLWAMPIRMTVAVGPIDSGQWRFMQATSKALRETRGSVRLRLVAVDDSAAAGSLLDASRVDLAVLRSDDPTSKDARSIVILHRRAVMLVSPKGKALKSVADLKGKRIAIMRGETDTNKTIVEHVLTHHNLNSSDVDLQELSSGAVRAGIADGQLDGFFLVGHPAGVVTRNTLVGLRGFDESEIHVEAIAPAEGLARQYLDFEAIELPAGIFAGAPPLPEEEATTIAITYELVASDTLSERHGAMLAKALSSIRTRLRRYEPGTFDIELPPLDKVRRYLPHDGAAAFVNDEVKSLLELYSEEIWLTLFAASIMGSSITGFLGWAGIGPARSPSAAAGLNLESITRRLQNAASVSELDLAQADLDDFLLDTLADRSWQKIGRAHV